MQVKDLSEQFYKEIFRLSGWRYSPAAVAERSVFLRSAADIFIYKALSENDFTSLINMAKSSRMPIPPPLQSAINFESVQYKTLKVLEESKSCNTIEELEMTLNKKSETIEDVSDFNKLLSAFLAIPKN